MVKSLFLSWLGRFLNRANKSWQAIPNDSFKRSGGLPFLLKCNYDSKLVDKQPPLFYSEMLENFKELRKSTERTAVKRWSSFFPYFATSWKQSFNSICKSTKDNKLREFGYKILHRVLVTNKGLKKFKITNDDLCDQCKTPDSLEHTFLQCPANVKFYYEILSWFTVSHNTVIVIFPRSKF